MALSSAFRERLEQMELTRNQRLSLLQAEKEWQASKSHVLALKHANIRSMEQRCLVLDQKIASQSFKISILKSEIESLDAKYCTDSSRLRDLKREVEELGELEKERDRFYERKSSEMKDFRENVEKFVLECRRCVEELRNRKREVNNSSIEMQWIEYFPPDALSNTHQSSSMKVQGSNEYFYNSEIAEAEKRKSELTAMKENLDWNLASNYQLRAQLRKKVQNISY